MVAWEVPGWRWPDPALAQPREGVCTSPNLLGAASTAQGCRMAPVASVIGETPLFYFAFCCLMLDLSPCEMSSLPKSLLPLTMLRC